MNTATPGKEMGFIIEGKGELQYGRDSIEVTEGDSITFSSDSPHILKNTGKGKLTALWIITPPKMLFGKS